MALIIDLVFYMKHPVLSTRSSFMKTQQITDYQITAGFALGVILLPVDSRDYSTCMFGQTILNQFHGKLITSQRITPYLTDRHLIVCFIQRVPEKRGIKEIQLLSSIK